MPIAASGFARIVRLLLTRPGVPLLGAVLLLGGCSIFGAPDVIRGNKVDAYRLQELVPGTSTQADVTALIGSPTARATFDRNTWLYISESTHIRIGQTLGVDDQAVVALSFDDAGVLRGIKKYGQDNALPVTVVARTTPSPGTEASFLQQLFGNVGRFNAGAPSGSGLSGGAPSGGAPGGP